MFRLYKKYLNVIDSELANEFDTQKPFIKCKRGCSLCCESGDYPLSRLEMEYLMAGLTELDAEIQKKIRLSINALLAKKQKTDERFMHRCPFLSDEKLCYLYERRGLVCRTFGLASFENYKGKTCIKLPECVKDGLNYSDVFDGKEVEIEKFKNFGVVAPVKHSLSLNYYEKNLPSDFSGLEFGEIRPLLDWFIQKALK